MKTALLQVKEELGVDAVIMSNKKVAGGVEIVAAVDGEPSASPAVSQPRTQQPYSSQPRFSNSQVSQSLTRQPARRELEDDRVSLQASAAEGRSMTQRFANMLKQYSNGAMPEQDTRRADNEDSLSALLQRQREQPFNSIKRATI